MPLYFMIGFMNTSFDQDDQDPFFFDQDDQDGLEPSFFSDRKHDQDFRSG